MRQKTALFLLVILSLPVIYPLTGSGFILTHDQYFPVHRLVALNRCFSEGQFPPRWTDLFALGYGYPFFNYYAPLAYYITAIFFFFTHNYILSIHSIFGFALMFGGWGAYFWLKEHFGECASLAGGTLYIYLPYHLVNAYVRGDISELIASSLFPWVFWSYTKLFHKQNIRFWMIISALFYSWIMLSHNIMSMLFTGFLLLYFVFLIGLKKDWKSLGYAVISWVLGLGLSLYFWLPAFMEKKYIQVELLLNAAQYKEHFVYFSQFFNPHWGYGGSVPGTGDDMSLQLGLIPTICALASIPILYIKKNKNNTMKPFVYFYWGALITFIFIMSPISRLIWDLTPLLHYTLFPWRFLSLVGIPLVFLSAFTIDHLREYWISKNSGNKWVVIICCLGVMVTIPYLHKRKIPLSDELASRTNIWRTELVSKTFGTTMSNEYLPKTVLKMPEFPAVNYIVSDEGAVLNYTPIAYKSTEQIYEFDLDKESNVVFALFYFPGWTLWVDNDLTKIHVNEQGEISANIPKGRHMVRLMFKNTPLRLWANYGTLVSIFVWVLLGMQAIYRYKKII